MRRLSLVIAMILCSGFFGLLAQTPASFGVKGGVGLAMQKYRITSIDHDLETNPLPGPAVALFVESFKGERFSFQFDLGYMVKGHCTTTHSVSVDHLNNDQVTVNKGKAQKSKFHYMSLAPLARYRYDLERMSPYALLGPRVDFLLNYGTESDYPLYSQNHTLLGLTIGAGLEFQVQNMGLFAEIQYQPDLTPVINEDPLFIRNSMLSLSLGIRWIAFSE